MSMQTNVSESIAKLVPGGGTSLAHLSDNELHANTRCLVGANNRLLAALLLHLAEVEARGIHRTRACSSLYTYCIYELRFSEDAAARRAGAAKLVKRFPAVNEAISNGELHLTGLLMLGPHLTDHNLDEVLGRAKFRTKKELGKLVRELHPLPLVADSIEPLRPEPKAPRNPTWQDYVCSLAPLVRELPAGQRPSEWMQDGEDATVAVGGSFVGGEAAPFHAPARVEPETALPFHAPARVEPEAALPFHAPARVEPGAALPFHASARVEPETALPFHASARVEPETALPFHASARVELEDGASSLAPVINEVGTGETKLQYHMQFTTSEEHVQLVERAKALLATRSGGKSLSELHVEAMRLLVSALEKQRFGATNRRLNAESVVSLPEVAQCPAVTVGSLEGAPDGDAARTNDAKPSPQPARARYIPASVRRAVFERDGARCTYVDERGKRCRETSCLELHHRQAFGKGGPNTVENLTLHCSVHNGLAADLDFGREWMEQHRAGGAHESVTSQEPQARRCVGFDR